MSASQHASLKALVLCAENEDEDEEPLPTSSSIQQSKQGEAQRTRTETGPPTPPAPISLRLSDPEANRETDPFLYYSVTGARGSEILGRGIDGGATAGGTTGKNGRGDDSSRGCETATRSTRISFGCHHDPLLEHLAPDGGLMLEDLSVEELEGLIDQLLPDDVLNLQPARFGGATSV